MLLLADIGNSRVHIYENGKVSHYGYDEALGLFGDKKVSFISVKKALNEKVLQLKKWKNISETLHIAGEYDTMGVDRKALCLSKENGVFIDAGSAITVDIVKSGVYQGGFILLGLQAQLQAYRDISLALDVAFDKKCNLLHLPKTTQQSVSYGIIAPIKAIIDKHSEGLSLYFTGGDGEWLSSYFTNSIFDESLIFKGIQKALKD